MTKIRQFAVEHSLSPETLQKTLRSAGVGERSLDDMLTEQEKSQLLDYLRRFQGTADGARITITRKETSQVHNAQGRTVQVETRKRRSLAVAGSVQQTSISKPIAESVTALEASAESAKLVDSGTLDDNTTPVSLPESDPTTATTKTTEPHLKK